MVPKVLLGILVLIVVIAAGLSYAYINMNSTNSGNSAALSSLNERITAYGSNFRYMLHHNVSGVSQNLSAYVNMSNTQPSIYGAVKSLYKKYTGLSQINSTNWNMQNPSVRYIVLNASYTLGLFGGMNLTDIEAHNIVPSDITPLQLFFSLGITGNAIYLVAQNLIWLYNNMYFNALSTRTINGSSFEQNVPVNDLGVGIAVIPELPSLVHPEAVTSELNVTFYDSLSLDFSPSWLELMYSIYGIDGLGFPLINNSTATGRLAYVLATAEYSGYYASEMLYNRTISPGINFIGYLNNTLMLDMGNLNLNNTNISIYIDGNQTSYNRYYNLVLVYNKHLGVGEHTIRAVVNGISMADGLYVSPVLPTDIVLLEPASTPSNKTNVTADLSFSIYNPYPTNMVVSNISVVSGLVEKPVISSPNISTAIFNWTGYKSTTPVLYNVSYSKFNFLSHTYDNHTGKELFTPNFTAYAIPINASYQIGRNDGITLNYTVSSFPNTIDTMAYYTVTFDTNYGKARSVIAVKLT